MYYWFYTRTSPTLVQAWDQSVLKDQGEFLEFENIFFVRSLADISTPALVAASPSELASFTNKEIVTTVSNLSGQVIWEVVRVGQ
jgi:hypothetical protein